MATVHIRLPNGSLQELSHPDNWSDAQVKEAIYKHFPVNANNQKSSNDEKGYSGIVNDAEESLSNVPSALGDFISQLPGQAASSGSQIVNKPGRAIGNLLAGLLEGGKGALNIPSNISRYLSSKGISQDPFEGRDNTPKYGARGGADLLNAMHIDDTGLQQAVLGDEEAGDALLQGIGSFAPYARLGGLAKGLAGTAKRAGGASAYATGQNQDPLVAALMGIAGEGAVRGASKLPAAIKNLDPARALRGQLSADELASNLRAASGTNTPLGSVLENPALKNLFENVTSNVPFSGAKDILSNIKTQVEGRGEGLMKDLQPEGVTGDTNELVKSLLDTAYKEHRTKKNELYNERNALAEKEGLKLNLSNFNKLASDTAKSIEDSPLYQNDPDFKRVYRRLLGFKNTEGEGGSQLVDKQGKPLSSRSTSPSISEATMTANTLYDEGQRMSSSPSPKDRSLGGLYKRMSKTLKNDVESSIENSGSEPLKKAHSAANQNYKKNFTQFLDKNVYKLLGQDKDPQKIVHEIIRPGAKQDQYRDIEKINKLLPPEQKNLLGFTYLKGAEDKLGQMDPKTLASLVRSLGNRQFKALFPEDITRQQILDYGKLRGMNEEALNVLVNPKTGNRTAQTIIGGMQGGFGIMGNPVLAALPSVLSNATNRVLTSPSVREKLVKRMLEQSKKETKSKTPKNVAPLVQAMMQMGNRNQEKESKNGTR